MPTRGDRIKIINEPKPESNKTFEIDKNKIEPIQQKIEEPKALPPPEPEVKKGPKEPIQEPNQKKGEMQSLGENVLDKYADDDEEDLFKLKINKNKSDKNEKLCRNSLFF